MGNNPASHSVKISADIPEEANSPCFVFCQSMGPRARKNGGVYSNATLEFGIMFAEPCNAKIFLYGITPFVSMSDNNRNSRTEQPNNSLLEITKAAFMSQYSSGFHNNRIVTSLLTCIQRETPLESTDMYEFRTPGMIYEFSAVSLEPYSSEICHEIFMLVAVATRPINEEGGRKYTTVQIIPPFIRSLPTDMAQTIYAPICVQTVPVLALPPSYFDVLDKPPGQSLLSEWLSFKMGTEEIQRTLTQWYMLKTKEEEKELLTKSDELSYPPDTSIASELTSARFFNNSGCPMLTNRRTYFGKTSKNPVYLDSLLVRKNMLENIIRTRGLDWILDATLSKQSGEDSDFAVPLPFRSSRGGRGNRNIIDESDNTVRKRNRVHSCVTITEAKGKLKECMSWHEDVFPKEWWEALINGTLNTSALNNSRGRTRATSLPKQNKISKSEAASVSDISTNVVRSFNIYFTKPVYTPETTKKDKNANHTEQQLGVTRGGNGLASFTTTNGNMGNLSNTGGDNGTLPQQNIQSGIPSITPPQSVFKEVELKLNGNTADDPFLAHYPAPPAPTEPGDQLKGKQTNETDLQYSGEMESRSQPQYKNAVMESPLSLVTPPGDPEPHRNPYDEYIDPVTIGFDGIPFDPYAATLQYQEFGDNLFGFPTFNGRGNGQSLFPPTLEPMVNPSLFGRSFFGEHR